MEKKLYDHLKMVFDEAESDFNDKISEAGTTSEILAAYASLSGKLEGIIEGLLIGYES